MPAVDSVTWKYADGQLAGFFAINWCIRQCATTVSSDSSASVMPITRSLSRAAGIIDTTVVPLLSLNIYVSPLCNTHAKWLAS